MKCNKLLAAGILTLGLTTCTTLASCNNNNTSIIDSINKDTSVISPSASIPSTTTISTSSSSSSSSTTFDAPDVEAWVQKDPTSFTYTPYSEEFKIEKSSSSQVIAIAQNVYTIRSAGTYTLSGNLENGRIEVRKETGDVTLILNNVSISGIDAAIWVKKSNNVTIVANEGTINYFKDGSKENFAATFVDEADDEPKGTIFSKSPLTINGKGSIYVTSSATSVPFTSGTTTTYESVNGIQVKDDLTISETSLYINSVNNGIKNKGKLNISDANVEITALDDGITTDYDEDVETDNQTGIITFSNNNMVIKATNDGIQSEYGFVSTSGEYHITSGTNGSVGTTDSNSHKAIKVSYSDTTSITLLSTIEISGGKYYLDTLDDGLHSDDNITLSGGTFVIKAKDDGIHADNNLVIEGDGPSINILSSYEGLEALDVTIDSGFIYVVSQDDGINAAGGNDNNTPTNNNRPGGGHWGGGFNNPGTTDGAVVTINGGVVIVNSSGDGIDSNGNVIITDGVTIVNANVSGDNTALDFDGSCQISGGIFIAAGSSGMLEYPSSSSQKVLCARGSSRFNNSTYYGIFDSSNNLVASFKSIYQTSSIFFSSPDLKNNGTYTIRGGGSYTGGSEETYGYSTGGTYTGGTNLSLINR